MAFRLFRFVVNCARLSAGVQFPEISHCPGIHCMNMSTSCRLYRLLEVVRTCMPVCDNRLFVVLLRSGDGLAC